MGTMGSFMALPWATCSRTATAGEMHGNHGVLYGAAMGHMQQDGHCRGDAWEPWGPLWRCHGPHAAGRPLPGRCMGTMGSFMALPWATCSRTATAGEMHGNHGLLYGAAMGHMQQDGHCRG